MAKRGYEVLESLQLSCDLPSVTAEALDLWWKELKKRNKKNIKERVSSRVPFFFASEKLIRLICNIGDSLELSRDIMLSSVMLFDRYMNASYILLKEANPECTERMKMPMKDIIFSICCCLILSSKAVGKCEVQIPDVIRYLSEQELLASKRDIFELEVKVFKMLDFKIPLHSPMIYVETLVYMLPNADDELEVEELLETCLEVMMVAHTYHETLYDSLFYIFTSKKKCNVEDRYEMVTIENDQVFLAGGIVLSAAYIMGVNNICVLQTVASLTGVPLRELQRLQILILEITTDTIPTDLPPLHSNR